MLYSVQMQGNPGYLHVVIEHQSKPDKKMAFRMMRYSIAAMHRHLEADHDKLPLVVPILFYQGEATPYPLSMCWFDMFYSPELARRVYNSPFPLVDITITHATSADCDSRTTAKTYSPARLNVIA